MRNGLGLGFFFLLFLYSGLYVLQQDASAESNERDRPDDGEWEVRAARQLAAAQRKEL
jgi:hypothetical protein